jgi:hypothetical protein
MESYESIGIEQMERSDLEAESVIKLKKGCFRR